MRNLNRNFTITQSQDGLSLVLVIMSVFAIGLTSAALILSAEWFFSDKAVKVTEHSMRQIGLAVSGKNIRGVYGPRHYEQDMSALPNSFDDLIVQPVGIPNCALDTQSATLHGWCGPYLIAAYQGQGLWSDGWGRSFVFERNSRRIKSLGPNGTDENGAGDDLVQNF